MLEWWSFLEVLCILVGEINVCLVWWVEVFIEGDVDFFNLGMEEMVYWVV